VQYPDRPPQPVTETVPERFRGLLEVDVLCCTGCQACERACPIGVIRINMAKEGKIRFIERFDIDLSKCMYCGFCVEACPVDAQSVGDQEITHSIRFTREFEGCSADINTLVYRYVRPGDRIVVAKNKKGQIHPTAKRGERLREAKSFAARTNPDHIGAVMRRRASDPLFAKKQAISASFVPPSPAQEKSKAEEKKE